ncbi:MAG TPA: hypothetical protein VGB78_03460 [Thermoplasmata archaeon]
MENPEGVNRLFIELASEDRLGVLRALHGKDLKMRELGRQLNLTATEIFRQLKRLSEAQLVQKMPDGSYSISPYGGLVLQLSASHEFVFKHRDYFLAHDLSRLPYPFINRIGELSQASLSMESYKNITWGEELVGQAQQYFWAIVEGPGNERLPVATGVKYRFLLPESLIPIGSNPPGSAHGIETRGLSDMPAIVALTEKHAGVFFYLLNGRTDYTGFLAEDSNSLDWVKDLFQYYWDKGKRPLTV